MVDIYLGPQLLSGSSDSPREIINPNSYQILSVYFLANLNKKF